MKRFIALILSTTLCFTLASCSKPTTPSLSTETIKLSENFKSNNGEYMYFGKTFASEQNVLALNLFTEINNQKPDENIVFSPISISSVLGILYSGADGETQKEFQKFFSSDSGTVSNSLYTYFDTLPETISIKNVNSLWIKNDERLNVKNDFLQHNANFYNADVYKVPFDNTTKNTINSWIKDATDGNIKEIVDIIDENACMFLINALTFDAEWHTPYAKQDISKKPFYSPSGTITTEMMQSRENYYIKTNNAEGFIKEYRNGDYRFIALLPNKDINIDEYISLLKSIIFDTIVNNATQEEVIATIPKFKSTFEITLNDTLKALSISTAFNEDKANFSKLGTYQGGNLYLADVLQKAYITVDEKGTKAGAVTKAEIANKTSLPSRTYTVTLDRPFVYAIIDNVSNNTSDNTYFFGCSLIFTKTS